MFNNYKRSIQNSFEEGLHIVPLRDDHGDVEYYESIRDSCVAYKCLLEMRKVNPKCIMIYIGEGCGGYEADKFFDEAVEIEDSNFTAVKTDYQRWHRSRDEPRLFL